MIKLKPLFLFCALSFFTINLAFSVYFFYTKDVSSYFSAEPSFLNGRMGASAQTLLPCGSLHLCLNSMILSKQLYCSPEKESLTGKAGKREGIPVRTFDLTDFTKVCVCVCVLF